MGSIGSFRKRLPVAAKIALVSAGAIAAVPGSPMPQCRCEIGHECRVKRPTVRGTCNLLPVASASLGARQTRCQLGLLWALRACRWECRSNWRLSWKRNRKVWIGSAECRCRSPLTIRRLNRDCLGPAHRRRLACLLAVTHPRAHRIGERCSPVTAAGTARSSGISVAIASINALRLMA